MHWNCPHCEELVTAGIDFGSTAQAYVRCRPCGGMAVVRRGASVIAAPVATIRTTSPTAAPTETATPPPFRRPQTDGVAAAPPIFVYPKPPAFLLKSAPEVPIENSIEKTSIPSIAVWLAALTATATGIYLYSQIMN